MCLCRSVCCRNISVEPVFNAAVTVPIVRQRAGLKLELVFPYVALNFNCCACLFLLRKAIYKEWVSHLWHLVAAGFSFDHECMFRYLTS